MYAGDDREMPPGGEPPRCAEIRHLAALTAVARERSFRAAARSLGCGQSDLIQQITELEEAVGVRLVTGAPPFPETSLTEAGGLMLAHAEDVLARVAATRADLEWIGDTRPLRVGAYESIARRVLPAVLQRLEGLPVAAREADDDGELLEAVERGEADLTFAELPLPPGPFEWTSVLKEPYVLVVPARSAVEQLPPGPGLSEVRALPVFGRSGGRSPNPGATGHGRGERARIVRRVGSDAGVRALVASGVGAAILPRLSLEPSEQDVVTLDLGRALGYRELALVSHRNRRLPRAAARFCGIATAVCAELERRWRDLGGANTRSLL